jgi:methyl-accepting chemotaxis protein
MEKDGRIMAGKIKRAFPEHMIMLWNRIAASMRLKFMIALTGVISIFLVLCTFLVARMLMEGEYRALEARGRNMGQLLSKAITDPLLRKEQFTVDDLVAEAARSHDVLYTYVLDASNKILNTSFDSFNSTRNDVKEFLTQEQNHNMDVLVNRAKDRLDALEVQTDGIMIGSTRLATVKIGLSRDEVRSDTKHIVWMLAGTSMIIIGLLVLMVSVMVKQMIVRPTTEALTVASNIAAGDLSQNVRVQTVDELGRLGLGLNSMISGLKGMIVNVRDAALKTEVAWREAKEISAEITNGSRIQAESVEEAASSINEMHFSLQEIADNMNDLSATSVQTSSSIMEMAASISEVAGTMTELSSSIGDNSSAIMHMSAAVRQIAENAEVLSTTADETAATTEEINASVKEVESHAKESAALAEAVAADAQHLGMRSIEKTIEGMNRIEATARRTANVINRLGERAENIGSILTVIEDITDQTGLLALNAAILAAQAGEHGKGFAVVAAEIRELANRTSTSTQEIGKLITSVQEESREAVGVMREEVTMVEEGVRLARDAEQALRKILDRADLSRDMSRGINKAAAEQARGIRQVSEAVSKITAMTHQIARAVNEQKIGSEQITRTSEKMREFTVFAKNSTDAQAQGGKQITAAVENMNAKISMVNRGTGEVQTGSDLIVQAMQRIKEIAKANTDEVGRLHNALEVMIEQSEMLKKEIAKFKT